MIPKKLIAVLLVTSFSLTGCGLVETTKEKLGLEQSAEELVAEACALYSKTSTNPSRESLELFKQALSKDENYRTLFEKVQSVGVEYALLKTAKGNVQVTTALITRILDSNAYIASYCG